MDSPLSQTSGSGLPPKSPNASADLVAANEIICQTFLVSSKHGTSPILF